MTQSVSDFEQQLGRELRAAGYRRLQGRRLSLRTRQWRPAALTAAAVAVVLVAAVLASAGLRPRPAAAHPFRIVHLSDEVRLHVVEVVTDPGAAARSLHDELGIDVEFVALPAPPELVGHVVALSSTGTTVADPVYDDAGRAEQFVLPRQVDGRLSVHYGREAHPGENYQVNITAPVCRELWAMTPQQTAASLAGLADEVRYDTIDAGYSYSSDVALDEVDADYRLIEVMFLAQDRLLTVYSAHLDALGADRPECGWSAALPD